MEKPKGRRKNMSSNPFCMPRLRGRTTKKTNRLSPMSLLDRLREAVFRLIMLSAISKVSNDQSRPVKTQRSYYSNDPHHSEAVADCIEFIKKSATTDENRDSSASSSIDAAPEVVIPVAVYIHGGH